MAANSPTQPVTSERPSATRPLVVVGSLIVGWLVIVGLTALTITRYRVSEPSVPTTVDAAAYLSDIRDRLARW